MNLISLFLFICVLLPSVYWFVLALAARSSQKPEIEGREPRNRFAIVIPAHNEENVINVTVSTLLNQNYPRLLYDIFVVADFCSDQTAREARRAGATVLERNDGERSGKGAALSWAFNQIFSTGEDYDAVVIFDADTKVDADFLLIMDVRLSQDELVIQGRHAVSNPNTGWLPALTWAMFIIDNRFQNLGRSNLGWSAKHMGDSICFRAEILRKLGWGEGLTEDYLLRQRLLLVGVRIAYEPYAIGFGEAALSWRQAQSQRARWLRGVQEANQQLKTQLFLTFLKKRDGLLLDGWLQALVPSYSTLALISIFLLLMQVIVNLVQPVFLPFVLLCWGVLAGLLILYPVLGLIWEGAPLKAYIAILLGPVFIFWRSWLALRVRLHKGRITWVRTEHHGS
ncbi:MAG: glycosyltransferase family 2 protein [Acidobacteriota bacterium]